MNLKLVKIEWLDILNDNNWCSFKDIDEKITGALESKYYSVGWLYKDTKEYIVILPSISLKPDGELEDVTWEFIPKGVIKKITKL